MVMTGSSALDDVQTLRQEAAASEADENRAPPTGTQQINRRREDFYD